LWKQLLSAHGKTGITVHFEWTLGKKSPVLKRVDKAAKAAANRGGPDIDRGYKPGAIVRSMVEGAATRFPAKGQSVVIRPYRHFATCLSDKSKNKLRQSAHVAVQVRG
jgi:hypothetical protein